VSPSQLKIKTFEFGYIAQNGGFYKEGRTQSQVMHFQRCV